MNPQLHAMGSPTTAAPPGAGKPFEQPTRFLAFLAVDCDLRTYMHFTLNTNALKREDRDESVRCYKPANRHDRQTTWSDEVSPPPQPSPVEGEGANSGVVGAQRRWRAYDDEEPINRDQASLDIFWLKDESLSESDNLPAPEVIAAEIVEDLEAALAQFREILGDFGSSEMQP